MKHLIVYAHLNPSSFCHAILECVIDRSHRKGHELVVRDLYALGFDPVLSAADFSSVRLGVTPADIATEQAHVAWAELITIIYPVWWTGLPAILKGYIDRVFLRGFAYDPGPGGVRGLLGGRRALLICTAGTPNSIYDASGMSEAMRLTASTGIFEFCDIEVIAQRMLGGVPAVDDAARRTMLAELERDLERWLPGAS